MVKKPDPLANWTPEQIEQGRRWVEAWKHAGPELERIRREELRHLDQYEGISRLTWAYIPELRPTSGLVEQQRWFQEAARHS